MHAFGMRVLPSAVAIPGYWRFLIADDEWTAERFTLEAVEVGGFLIRYWIPHADGRYYED